MLLNVRVNVSPETFDSLVTAGRGAGFVRKSPRHKWTHAERIEAASLAVRSLINRLAAKLGEPELPPDISTKRARAPRKGVAV